MLNEIVTKILLVEEDQITNDLSRDDVEEWDSMTHLVLISELEQEFNVVFSDDEIADVQDVGGLRNLLAKYGVENV